MSKAYRWRFAVGAIVTVKGSRASARIESRCPSIAPGAVRLDRPLIGLSYWNEEELRRKKRTR